QRGISGAHCARLRVNDNFTGRAAKENVQTIQYIATQNALQASEDRLKLARVFLTIQPHPNQEADGHGTPTADSANHSRYARGRTELKLLAICPRKRRRVGSRVGNDAIENHSSSATRRTEFGAHYGQCGSGIAGVIGE